MVVEHPAHPRPTPSSRLLSRPPTCRWIIPALLRSSRCGLAEARSVSFKLRIALSTGVIACFCIVRTRASSSRSSRRPSSNWRAASSLETIRRRISRLLPSFGPLIVSKIARLGMERDHRPHRQLERSELPVVRTSCASRTTPTAGPGPGSGDVQSGIATAACGSESPVASR